MEEARAGVRSAQAAQITIPIGSNTTIIGLRGASITGRQPADQRRDNVIIRNLTFEDADDCFPAWDPTDGATGNWNSEYDNVSLTGATHVWVDHNTFTDGRNPDSDQPSYFGRPYQVHDGELDIISALRPRHRLLEPVPRPRQDHADRQQRHRGPPTGASCASPSTTTCSATRSARAAGPVRPGRRLQQPLRRAHRRRLRVRLLLGGRRRVASVAERNSFTRHRRPPVHGHLPLERQRDDGERQPRQRGGRRPAGGLQRRPRPRPGRGDRWTPLLRRTVHRAQAVRRVVSALAGPRHVGQRERTGRPARTRGHPTVQAAVDPAPPTSARPVDIVFRPGVHKGVTVRPHKPNLPRRGGTRNPKDTVISFDNAGGTPKPGGGTYGTTGSASVTIAASDFTASNVTFENAFDEAAHPEIANRQAVAVKTTGDRIAFDNVRFLGNQDTLYVDSSKKGVNARVYVPVPTSRATWTSSSAAPPPSSTGRDHGAEARHHPNGYVTARAPRLPAVRLPDHPQQDTSTAPRAATTWAGPGTRAATPATTRRS